MQIVVNEWLLHYLHPDSQEEKKKLAIKFINIWIKRCDKILLRIQSPFTRKFYRFMNESKEDPVSYKEFKKLHNLLFRDSDKTVLIEEQNIRPLDKNIESKTPADDRYLVELAYSSDDKIIITTDIRLKEKLEDEPELKIYLLEEFLNNYAL